MIIKEVVQANKFNSEREGLILIERDAPSPSEKEIVEDVPHAQGVLDFSMIFGERKFENRTLTYQFAAFDVPYSRRKVLEQNIKRQLMLNSIGPIYDTHDKGYYWLGKCKSVEVEDDHEYNRLLVDIEFDVYPFMITIKSWFDDVWDTFNFDRDVAHFTKYEINGARTFELFNVGDVTVTPKIKVEKEGD